MSSHPHLTPSCPIRNGLNRALGRNSLSYSEPIAPQMVLFLVLLDQKSLARRLIFIGNLSFPRQVSQANGGEKNQNPSESHGPNMYKDVPKWDRWFYDGVV